MVPRFGQSETRECPALLEREGVRGTLAGREHNMLVLKWNTLLPSLPQEFREPSHVAHFHCPGTTRCALLNSLYHSHYKARDCTCFLIISLGMVLPNWRRTTTLPHGFDVTSLVASGVILTRVSISDVLYHDMSVHLFFF